MELFSLHGDKAYPDPTLCRAKDGAPRAYIPARRDGYGTRGNLRWNCFPSTLPLFASLMILLSLAPADIMVSEDRLVLPIAEVTGNLWMLENVDQ